MRSLKRWATFNLVGFLGVGVQIFALMALRDLGGVHYLVATALAVEAAVLHNFVWHERWTWVDRTYGKHGGILGRLARFNLTTGAVSIASNLLLMTLFVNGLGLHYIAANLITILACSILNFMASDLLVFTRATQ